MEYIYAVMILHKAKQKVNESSVKKVLNAAGIKVDEIRVKALINSLEGVDIKKVVKDMKLSIQSVIQPVIEVKKEVVKEVEKDIKTEQIASGLDRLFS